VSSETIKLITDLVPGDVITAFVHPFGRRYVLRGGPFEVASTEDTGRWYDGASQVKITSTSRTRAARYSNGATHVVIETATVDGGTRVQ